MKSVGEKYVLEYDVTLIMQCNGSNEYIIVTNEFDTSTNLLVTETRRGKLTIELIKSYAESAEKEVTIECLINAEPVDKPNISIREPKF